MIFWQKCWAASSKPTKPSCWPAAKVRRKGNAWERANPSPIFQTAQPESVAEKRATAGSCMPQRGHSPWNPQAPYVMRLEPSCNRGITPGTQVQHGNRSRNGMAELLISCRVVTNLATLSSETCPGLCPYYQERPLTHWISGQVEQGGFTSEGRRVEGPIHEPGKGSEEVILQRNIDIECGCFRSMIPCRAAECCVAEKAWL
jgi:hypothetical protein